MNTAIAWYLWQGDIFRVPLSTLHRQKQQGELDRIHVAAKSRALLYYRLKSQSQGTGTPTAAWIRKWDLLTPSKNPPNINRILANMECMRRFAMDTAYLARQGQTESRTIYKRRIYNATCSLLSKTTEPSGMRVTRLWPNTDWARVWWNLQEAPVSEATKATWYRAIHDIVPPHEPLHKIRMVPTDLFRLWNRTDTLQHRLTECGEGPTIWD